MCYRCEPVIDRDAVPACMTWEAPEPGMTIEQWQAGRCAGCGFRGNSALIRDHDHATGLERGLLCRSCNAAEGQATVIGLWTRWRSGWNPAAILGIEREYDGGWAWEQKQRLEAMLPESTAVDEAERRAAIDLLGSAAVRHSCAADSCTLNHESAPPRR